MTKATRELTQAVYGVLFESADLEKGVARDSLLKAWEAVRDESNRRIRVTPDKSGLDNERYEAMAGPLEAVIANMGLTTPAQVLALCDMAYGQQGKLVVHTSSGCVSVREGGRNGREMFWIKGEGPEWE